MLTRLNAAKGGGYILQSDHSIPNSVDPATCDYVVGLAREYGRYPLIPADSLSLGVEMLMHID